MVLDKPAKANFIAENSDNSKFMIVGAGILRIAKKNSDYDWEITPPKGYLTNGKLQIRMTERIENAGNLNAEFLVEVKTEQKTLYKNDYNSMWFCTASKDIL